MRAISTHVFLRASTMKREHIIRRSVDMSAFGGNVGDPMSFDCLFFVDLRK
jgi:hypothetical protein